MTRDGGLPSTPSSSLLEARPPCARECTAVLREHWSKACARAGIPVPEAHITHIPPLIPPAYEPLNMRCPHGVLWYMEPTSEQVAQWAKDGVE